MDSLEEIAAHMRVPVTLHTCSVCGCPHGTSDERRWVAITRRIEAQAARQQKAWAEVERIEGELRGSPLVSMWVRADALRAAREEAKGE